MISASFRRLYSVLFSLSCLIKRPNVRFVPI
jgi:hypothetical protein